MHIAERNDFYKITKEKLNMDIARSPSDEDKLKYIFQSEDLAILNAFGKYIKAFLKKRENTICHILEPHFIYYTDKT